MIWYIFDDNEILREFRANENATDVPAGWTAREDARTIDTVVSDLGSSFQTEDGTCQLMWSGAITTRPVTTVAAEDDPIKKARLLPGVFEARMCWQQAVAMTAVVTNAFTQQELDDLEAIFDAKNAELP